MILEPVLFLLVSLILILYYKSKNIKSKKYIKNSNQIPEASGGLPIFGHFFKFSNLFEYLNNLKEIYGPIFSIQLGLRKIIVINSFELLKKTLKDHGNNFSGRWQNFFTRDLAQRSGILFTEKELWATQRSFTLRALKDFGLGKRIAEDVIHREVDKLVKIINLKSGRNIDINESGMLVTINVICDFIMKKEYQESDYCELSIHKLMKEASNTADINSLWINLFPILEWFPNISVKLINIFRPLKIIEAVFESHKYIQSIVDDHKRNFNPNNECQDLIDAFIYEQHKLKMAGLKDHFFTDFQLVRLIAELLFAGFETTSTTMSWMFLLLAKYPDVQNRLREEINNEIGLNKIPMMTDKKSLNYCQAVLDEIYRCSTVLPFAIAHRSLDDVVVDGYFIPRDSIIYPNVYSCHRDKSYWEKPFEFYPNHFLDESGNYKPKPEMIVFGIGKRQCLGEALARMEEFIVLVSLIQKFEISLEDSYRELNIVQILNSKKGSTRPALEHKLYFKEIFEKS